MPVGATLLTESAQDGSTAPATNPPAPSPITPVSLDLDLADLARGPDPTVGYIDGDTWVSDGSATELELPAGVTAKDVAQFDDGLLVWGSDQGGTVRLYPRDFDSDGDGGTVSTTAFRGDATFDTPVVDDVTGAVAFALDQTSIYYGTTLAKLTTFFPAGVTNIRVLDAYDGIVAFGGTVNGRGMVGRVDVTTGPTSYEPITDLQTDVDATGFSIAANLMGHLSDKTVPGDFNDSRCTVLTDLDDPDAGWESCDFRAENFSPDGTRVYGVHPTSEGFGPRQAAVLDSATGDALIELTAKGTIGFGESWESNEVIGITAFESDAAVVRCTVGVGCELATDPKPAPPDSLIAPYRLTAN